MQSNVQLTDEELDLVHRLARSENPDADYDREHISSLLLLRSLSSATQHTNRRSRRSLVKVKR